MKLISAILTRDEASPERYLRRVIERCQRFSDTVLVLDDRSQDGTAELAESLGCKVKRRSVLNERAWGHEVPARKELWDWATAEAGPDNGWALICDADMLLEGDPRPLCMSWLATAWAWPLADLWDDEQHYRVDGPWAVGPATPRPWLFKTSAQPVDWQQLWQKRGIHCGHAPANFSDLGPCLPAPPDLYWRHYSFLSAAHRKTKWEQYMAVADQLTGFERAHAASIIE